MSDQTYTIKVARSRDDKFTARLITKNKDEIASGSGRDSEEAILEMAKQLNAARRET